MRIALETRIFYFLILARVKLIATMFIDRVIKYKYPLLSIIIHRTVKSSHLSGNYFHLDARARFKPMTQKTRKLISPPLIYLSLCNNVSEVAQLCFGREVGEAAVVGVREASNERGEEVGRRR